MSFIDDEALRCDTDIYMEQMIREAGYFKEAGGNSIIECSVQGLRSRPVTDLVTISEKAGVHVIAGLGLYAAETIPDVYRDQDEKGMKKLLEKQLDGLEGTGIKPGFVKAALNYGRNPLELKAYRAVCALAAESGLPMLVHFACGKEDMTEIVEMAVKEIGVRPEKLMLCHVDGFLCEPQSLEQYIRTLEAPISIEMHKRLLDYGVILSFDGFGQQFPVVPETEGAYMATDYQKLAGLHRLIEEGYKNQLMVGHDLGMTISGASWGRYGFTRVPEFVCPMLKKLGHGDNVVDTITKTNPERFLSHE